MFQRLLTYRIAFAINSSLSGKEPRIIFYFEFFTRAAKLDLS